VNNADFSHCTDRLEVHFGAGITTLPSRRDIRDNTFYLFVDETYEEKFDYVESLVREFREANSNCLFLTCSGEDTGLLDDCVDNVRIINVLNSDDARYTNEARTLYKTGKPPFEEGILQEARRIVRPEGIIHVGASNTPYQFPLEDIITVASELHLACEVLFHQPEDYSDPTTPSQKFHDIAYSPNYKREKPLTCGSYMVAIKKSS